MVASVPMMVGQIRDDSKFRVISGQIIDKCNFLNHFFNFQDNWLALRKVVSVNPTPTVKTVKLARNGTTIATNVNASKVFKNFKIISQIFFIILNFQFMEQSALIINVNLLTKV